MGLARLNIWISGTDDPCAVDNRTWYVTIYDCDGNVLDWCGRRYVVIPARCGHLEVEVPPGCYRVNAVWSFSFAGGIFYVNHLTDSAIVHTCCDQHVCVKLFNPSTHRCGTIFLRAVRDLVAQKAIKPDVAQPVEQAINRLLQFLPRPAKGFELDDLDEIEKLVREQERRPHGEQRGTGDGVGVSSIRRWAAEAASRLSTALKAVGGVPAAACGWGSACVGPPVGIPTGGPSVLSSLLCREIARGWAEALGWWGRRQAA